MYNRDVDTESTPSIQCIRSVPVANVAPRSWTPTSAHLMSGRSISSTMGSPVSRPPAIPPASPSLIETIRVDAGGIMPLLDGHLARLQSSARMLGYAFPGVEKVGEALKQRAGTLCAQQSWRLRLLLDPAGDIVLEHSPLESTTETYKVCVAGPRPTVDMKWLLHKTTHRPWYAQAAKWLAEHPDIFDVLYWDENGEMCEGSRSNLYMLAPDGRWLTPPLRAGALPGVQRQALLQAGLVEEARILRDDFLQARAWRISNALRGWCDAVIVDGS